MVFQLDKIRFSNKDGKGCWVKQLQAAGTRSINVKLLSRINLRLYMWLTKVQILNLYLNCNLLLFFSIVSQRLKIYV